MKLYQQIDIDNLKELQAAILSIIPDKRRTETDLFYLPISHYMMLPEFRKMIEQLDLSDHVGTIATIVVAPGVDAWPIHVDSGDMRWSLNIPIQHCEGTWTTWYETTKPPVYMDRPGKDTGYYCYNLEDCRPIDQLEMTKPYIIDIHTPHGIVNPTDQTRILMAVRLRNFEL